MPENELHQKKRFKNYALLGVLVALMLIFYALTIVKIQNHTAPAAADSKSSLETMPTHNEETISS